jgi:hypothetical protein
MDKQLTKGYLLSWIENYFLNNKAYIDVFMDIRDEFDENWFKILNQTIIDRYH